MCAASFLALRARLLAQRSELLEAVGCRNGVEGKKPWFCWVFLVTFFRVILVSLSITEGYTVTQVLSSGETGSPVHVIQYVRGGSHTY